MHEFRAILVGAAAMEGSLEHSWRWGSLCLACDDAECRCGAALTAALYLPTAGSLLLSATRTPGPPR